MASTNASLHIRSISLPSSSHPFDASIEDHLHRLSASQAGPSLSSSLCRNLCDIKDLYEHLNDSISFPHNQKALSKGKVDEVLKGSLVLLDVSGCALDAVSQMKEAILELQSSLRRNDKDEGVHAYLMARRKIAKTVSKCLSNLKKANKKSSSENDGITLRTLKVAESISLSMLKSVLSFVMGKKADSWFFVANLVKSKAESNNASEVEEVDNTIRSLSEKHKGVEANVLPKQLKELEMIIHELGDGLQSVSRCLIKTRVSLLNVLN